MTWEQKKTTASETNKSIDETLDKNTNAHYKLHTIEVVKEKYGQSFKP